jgi:hypothetical protein
MTADQIRLSEQSNEITRRQLDILLEEGITDMSDDVHIKLPENKKKQYELLQRSLEIIQRDMLRLALGEHNESPSTKKRFKTEVIRHLY